MRCLVTAIGVHWHDETIRNTRYSVVILGHVQTDFRGQFIDAAGGSMQGFG